MSIGDLNQLIFIVRPIIMDREDDYFCLYRMCPPNSQVKYFFSNPLQGVQLFAKDQRTTYLNEYVNLRKTGVLLVYSDGTYMQS